MADVIEAATSGRAKCRACRVPVAKGELRFGERVPNPYGEGEATFWYHLDCAALRLPEKVETLLQVPANSTPEEGTGDPPLASVEVPDPLRGELRTTIANAKAHPRLRQVVGEEDARTGKARCQFCREAIERGERRIVLGRVDDGVAGNAGFLHAGCAEKEFGVETLRQRLAACAKADHTSAS